VSKAAGNGNDNKAGYANLQGVGRALAILEALAEQPMRAQDLARHLDLKWTTAYRTLSYLEDEEYLRRSEATNEYSVGPRLYRVGSAYLAAHPFANVVPPHLKAAADAMSCAAQANERQGHTVVTIAAVESPLAIRKTSPGFTFPLGLAAKGQLLLAFAPEDVQEEVLSKELPRFTQHTLTDARQLRERLQQIRADGFASTREDLQTGVGSVAAPIQDREDRVIGGISLVVRSSRMDDAGFVEELVTTAQQAAHDVSLAVGWRPRAVQP
jgi:DNA-binding IclR family transcriptional regulator